MSVGYGNRTGQTKKEIIRRLAIMKKVLIFAFAILSMIGESVSAQNEVNAIWVKKSERKLHLLTNWEITHTFAISLGKNPIGHKRKLGDSRTPEGLYYIDRRNPDSRFFRSLGISFPNDTDQFLAKLRGEDPGGDIMIHGEPNDPIKRRNLAEDWTEGCIAMKDEDMRIVWQLVKEGTPILIMR